MGWSVSDVVGIERVVWCWKGVTCVRRLQNATPYARVADVAVRARDPPDGCDAAGGNIGCCYDIHCCYRKGRKQGASTRLGQGHMAVLRGETETADAPRTDGVGEIATTTTKTTTTTIPATTTEMTVTD